MATFTLPEGLRNLARKGQRIIYDRLFQPSQQALQKTAAYPKYIGGTLGMIGLLQTKKISKNTSRATHRKTKTRS